MYTKIIFGIDHLSKIVPKTDRKKSLHAPNITKLQLKPNEPLVQQIASLVQNVKRQISYCKASII